jgi:hypothetical protein
MSLFATALAALAFGLPASVAEKYSHQQLNVMLEDGHFDKKKILSKATQLGGVNRKLENSNYNEEGTAVNGNTTIRFN